MESLVGLINKVGIQAIVDEQRNIITIGNKFHNKIQVSKHKNELRFNDAGNRNLFLSMTLVFLTFLMSESHFAGGLIACLALFYFAQFIIINNQINAVRSIWALLENESELNKMPVEK
jgi:hypothetical protein